MIALILTLLLSGAEAATIARITDSCSGKPVAMTNPNGVKLTLSIDDLDPEDSVELTLTWRPAGLIEDLKPKDQLVWKYRFHEVNPDGTLKKTLPIPKASWLWQVQQQHDDYRIWDAEIFWVQERSRRSGRTVATFYHAPNVEPYFEITSPSLCEWEDRPVVSSKLYENLSPTWMNVVREYVETWERGRGPGLSLGYNNDTGGNVPIGALSNNSYGWAFKDFTKHRMQQEIFRYERRFVLNRDDSGVFIKRLSYTRHEANRYEWVQSGACGEFKKVSSGLVDIGSPNEDFIIIPKNFYAHPEVLNNYISIARPQLNSCSDSVGTGAEAASTVMPAGQDGLIFYYQNDQRRIP